MPGFDPAPPDTQRAVQRAMQGGRENGIGRTRRQVLGLRNEGGRRVVDQGIERSLRPGLLDHRLDSVGAADIAGDCLHRCAGLVTDPLSRGVEDVDAAPGEHKRGAKLGKAPGHGLAQTGAATGHQHASRGQQIRLEHSLSLVRCAYCGWIPAASATFLNRSYSRRWKSPSSLVCSIIGLPALAA